MSHLLVEQSVTKSGHAVADVLGPDLWHSHGSYLYDIHCSATIPTTYSRPCPGRGNIYND